MKNIWLMFAELKKQFPLKSVVKIPADASDYDGGDPFAISPYAGYSGEVVDHVFTCEEDEPYTFEIKLKIVGSHEVVAFLPDQLGCQFN